MTGYSGLEFAFVARTCASPGAWSAPAAIMAVSMANGLPSERESREARDAAINTAARKERLRRDGARSLGENLEQADALIRAAFELAAGMPQSRR
jgi:hypothetical protein